MAAQQVSDNSSDDDEFHSMSVPGEDDAPSNASDDALIMTPPLHPCPQLQAAFDESILESTEHIEHSELHSSATDAEMRRRKLLDPTYEEESAIVRWKQRPGAKYHPFEKLIAQLVFGMHLLKEGQAKSNEEVVKILQNHVNEVDGFLERTAEDFDLAIQDIEERTRHLKLPMQHMDVFQVMLDEKKFRTDLLNGNEKIEKIIARTAKAMNAAMHDIHNGIKSTKELSTYLDGIEKRWPADKRDIAGVFAAMRGNEQGWMSYLRDLRTKGDNLRSTLVVLESVIAEISRHAAAASRRNKTQGRQVSVGPQQSGKSSPLRSKFTRDAHSPYRKKPGAWLNKPLPKEPGSATAVKQATMAKPHPVPLATRFEQPRQTVPTPRESSSQHSRDRTRTPSRASAARDPNTSSQESTQELSDFFRNSGPLRSHPPDGSSEGRSSGRTSARSQSQGGGDSPNVSNKQFRRSRSHNAVAALTDSHRPPLSERKQIPRKPVGSVTRDDGTAAAVLKFQIPQVRDGFSRRISRRLKNIPAPLLSTNNNQLSAPAPQKDAVPQPIDSAHSSSCDRKPRFDGDNNAMDNVTGPREELLDREQETTLDIEKHPPLDPEKEPSRSETRGGHRLFPNVDKPLTRLQAVRYDDGSRAKETSGSNHSPPRTQNMRYSRARRTGSVRNFFSHRKDESRHLLVS